MVTSCLPFLFLAVAIYPWCAVTVAFEYPVDVVDRDAMIAGVRAALRHESKPVGETEQREQVAWATRCSAEKGGGG